MTATRPEPLLARFATFIRAVPGVEEIDELVLTPEQQKAKRADYFFCERAIVAELKSLQQDPAPKVEAVLEPHRERPEFPILYGEVQVGKVLKHLPDGEAIGRRIEDAVASALDKALRNANRQIRETKRTFGLPDRGGLAIILNDTVDILSPMAVVGRVQKLLAKRNPEGDLRFSQINAVWIVDETHFAFTPDDTAIGPTLIVVENDRLPDLVGVADYVARELDVRWSSFCGRPFVSIDPSQGHTLRFKPTSKLDSSGPVPRHEAWRADYRAQPYLRGWSHNDLITYGEWLVRQLSRAYLKGPDRTPDLPLPELWVRWTHFLEESADLGVNMKELSDRIPDLQM